MNESDNVNHPPGDSATFLKRAEAGLRTAEQILANLEGLSAEATLRKLQGQLLQLGRDEIPVVERTLQGRRDADGQVRGLEVARDDGKHTVARTVLKGCEFHRNP